MPEEQEDENEPRFTAGTTLSSSKDHYVLEELLGEGGFGAVWRVFKISDPTQKFAMKIEKKLAKRRHSKLKMEINILKLVLTERNENRHFTPIVDRGKTRFYFFLVMQLVGRSIEDLLHETGRKVFSLGTALGVGIQSMEALQDLHKYGFIHRDVKPANYACGLGNKSHVIYLLDFGIARKYVDVTSSMKTPRKQVNFKGTIRYASLSCHQNSEMGPKDDAESWFYMLFEFLNPHGLPWRRQSDRMHVLQSKEAFHNNPGMFLPSYFCREELELILKYVDSLEYTDRPDYEFIYSTLRLCAEIERVDLNAPYDWEPKLASLPLVKTPKSSSLSKRVAQSAKPQISKSSRCDSGSKPKH